MKILFFNQVVKWKANREEPVSLKPGKYDVVVFGFVSKADRNQLDIKITDVDGGVIKVDRISSVWSGMSKAKYFLALLSLK